MISSETKEEQIRKILRPLSHEKVIDILADLGVTVPGAFDKIYNAASLDVATRKIFVRGLGQTTTEDALVNLFTQFGEVAEVNIIRDKNSGQPKGYGFVTMQSIEAADNAVREPTKVIDGRQVFCNLAALRSPPQTGHISLAAAAPADNKIFVHGLGSELTEQMLREQFEKYGSVDEVNVVMDKHSNRSKGYGFVTFKEANAMRSALEYPEKQVNGKTLKCEMAGKPKQSNSPTLRPLPSPQQLQAGGGPPMLNVLHTHHPHSPAQLSPTAQISPSSPPVILAHPGSAETSMFAYANPATGGMPVHLNNLAHHGHSIALPSMVQGSQGRGPPMPTGAHHHVTNVGEGWLSQRVYFNADM